MLGNGREELGLPVWPADAGLALLIPFHFLLVGQASFPLLLVGQARFSRGLIELRQASLRT